MPTLSSKTKIIIKKIVIGAAVFYAIFNPNSYKLVKLIIEEHRIKNEIISLTKENDMLVNEIKRLTTDPEYYGYIVRRELGMIKEGEVEYRFSTGHSRRSNKTRK